MVVINFALGFPVSFLFNKATEMACEKFCGNSKGLGSGGSCTVFVRTGVDLLIVITDNSFVIECSCNQLQNIVILCNLF